jgi:acetyl-CoA acetyltransferase
MEKVAIVSGVRTAIGAYGGALKDLHVTKYAGLKRSQASTPEN